MLNAEIGHKTKVCFLLFFFFNIIVVQLLSHIWLFAPPWNIAHQASLSFTISLSLLKLTSIVGDANHLILYCPLPLLPSIFPTIQVFSNNFVYLLLAVLGLRGYTGFPLFVAREDHSSVAVCGLLIAVSSLVAEHGHPGSEIKSVSPVLAGRFFSTEPSGKPVNFIFLSYQVACRILAPRPESKPASLQWKCGVLTIGPPSKSQ